MQIRAVDIDRGRLDFGFAGKIVVLFGLTLSSYGLFGLSPVLPAIAAAFPGEPNAGFLTRLMVSSLGIFVAVVSPVVGAIADRVGRRRVLLASLLLYALAGCAPFFLNSLYAIVAVRIFQGIAVAAFGAVVLVMLVTHSTGAARNRWLGYLTMFATCMSIVYSPLVGYIGHYGWRWPFLTYAIALPLFLLAWVGFKADPPWVAQDNPRDVEPAAPRFSLGTPIKYVIFVMLAGAALVAAQIFLPFRLREIGIKDSKTIGLLLMPSAATSAIAGLVYGWLRARASMSSTFVLGFCLMAVGLAVIATAGGVPQFVIGQAIAGFGQGLNMPNYFGLAAVTGPDAYRARTMGFAKSGVYGGPLIAQFLLEPIVARTNFAVGVGLTSVMCAAFALFFGWRLISRHDTAALEA